MRLSGLQPIKKCQQPAPMVRQLGIEVLNLVSRRDGAAHRNIPLRPGARGGWLVAAADCMPEGKNRGRAELRDVQAFTWRSAWIQVGSSQELTSVTSNTFNPDRSPSEQTATCTYIRIDTQYPMSDKQSRYQTILKLARLLKVSIKDKIAQ